MKLAPFRLHRPETTAEARGLAAEYGFDAAYLAGGTELVLLMKLGLAAPRHVIDLKTVKGLDLIEIADDHIDIGAAVTHRQLERHPSLRQVLPEFARVESIIANRRVRSSGTLVGNLCFADPHSDPATLLTAMDASILISGPQGERRCSIGDFVIGPYMTDLEEGELVTSVRVGATPAGSSVAHERFKLKERPAVTVSVYVEMSDTGVDAARVVAGSVEPRPRRLATVESMVVASGPGSLPEVARAASSEAACEDDQDGSGEYKRHLIGVLTTRALTRAMREAGNGGRA